MTVAVVCAKCGAPLPRSAAQDGFVTCAYCNTTLRVDDGTAKLVKDGTPAAAVLKAEEEIRRRRKFVADLQERMTGGMPAYEAITSASRDNLEGLGHSDALARVTLAMAEDFDRENDTKTTTEGQSLSRLAEAYLKACIELRSTGRTEINLPFLTANGEGPKHFLLAVTAADFARLATRAPTPPAPPPPSPVAQEEPKKKGWWPF